MMRSSGFTLIEMLIAVIVVAMAGIVVSSTVSTIANQSHTLERRQAAQWVAANHVTRLKLSLRENDAVLPTGRDLQRATMASRRWELRTEVKSTDFPTLRRVEVEVYELVDGDPEGPIDLTVAFVGRF